MILTITAFLVNVFGLEYDTAKKWTRRGLVAVVFAVVFLIVLMISRCGDKPSNFKLNEAEIQRGEKAIKEANRKELEEILVDADVREKQIDKTIADGRTETINAIAESRKRYQEMTDAEIAAEFERRK